MSEPLVCRKCGHTEEEHDPRLLICEVKGCRCVLFSPEGYDENEDAEDDLPELNFDQEEDA